MLSSLDQRFIQESNKRQFEKHGNKCETPSADRQMSSGANCRVSHKSRNLNIQNSHDILQQQPNVSHLHQWFVALQRVISAASDPTSPLWQPIMDNCVSMTNEGQPVVSQTSESNNSTIMSPIMLAAITAATFQLMNNTNRCNPCTPLHSNIATNLTQQLSSSHLQYNLKTENSNSSTQIDVPSSSSSSVPLPAVYQMLNALALQETNSLNTLEIKHEKTYTHSQLDTSREVMCPICSEALCSHASTTSIPHSQSNNFQHHISTHSNNTGTSGAENGNGNVISSSVATHSTSHHQPPYPLTNNGSASPISYITQHLRQKKQQRLQRDSKFRSCIKATGENSADVSMTTTHTQSFTEESTNTIEEKIPYPLLNCNFNDDQEMGEAVDLSFRQNNAAFLERHRFTSARKRSKNYDRESAHCYSTPSTNKSIIALILKQNSNGSMDRLDKQKEVQGKSDGTINWNTHLNWPLSQNLTKLERFLETTIDASARYMDTLQLDHEEKTKIIEACWYRLFVIHVIGEEAEGFQPTLEELLLYISELDENDSANKAAIRETNDVDISVNKMGKNLKTFHAFLTRLIAKGCKLSLDCSLRRLACQIILINEVKRANLRNEHVSNSERELNTTLGDICSAVREGDGSKSEAACMCHAQFILFVNRVCSMPSLNGIREPSGRTQPDGSGCLQLLTSFRDKLQKQISMTAYRQESQ